MVTLSVPISKPIIVHASSKDCSRSILVSPSMTLYQLHIHLARSFDVFHNLDHHGFTLPMDKEKSIETYYEVISKDQQQDGFLTPIFPGVYIEHSHPHEPLPLFSICKQVMAEDEISMSFRMLRDERYVCLDAIPSRLYYNLHYHNIELFLQSVKLPMQFYNDIQSSPKLIYKQGHLFGQGSYKNNKSSCQLDTGIIQQQTRFYSILDEYIIREACRKGIDLLKKERRQFLKGQAKQSKCKWVEPNGDRCVYCTLV